MPEPRTVLVTGATGKVGRHLIDKYLDRDQQVHIRALCHHRTLPAHERIEIVRGSISDEAVVREAVDGVDAVVHMATCKETPESVMDVTVKGLFWLLEACRQSPTLQRFVLIGGDAGVGHFVYPREAPITEDQPHTPYPGCYALSKVLEEVMLEQYQIQYDFPGCCLRAPWIMEKDDFRFHLSWGDDVFGAPRWREVVGQEMADRHQAEGHVPVLCDATGTPLQRNFVHVDDLCEAILVALAHPAAHQQRFHVAMAEPVDYARVAEHLQATQGLTGVPVRSDFHSTWLDISKIRFRLGWHPRYDLPRLVDEAWAYERHPDDPRTIFYPG